MTSSFTAVLHALAAAPAALPRAPIARDTVIAGLYEVVERLGAGAMGTVYLARDRRLGRLVAIKLHAAADVAEATLREARAMARISHPAVVTVHDVGEHDGRMFVAMEYLDGGTLADWLRASLRPWPAIAERFVAAGRGLAAAHAVGLVHRDFKPANVLLGAGGRVCLADFGIAYDAGTRGAPAAGTPRFMAPEQRADEPVDPRADQYAFCVALREALAGTGAPPWLAPVLARGSEIVPAARWPSMPHLLDRIERGLCYRTDRYGRSGPRRDGHRAAG